jgi:hypothetical protein
MWNPGHPVLVLRLRRNREHWYLTGMAKTMKHEIASQPRRKYETASMMERTVDASLRAKARAAGIVWLMTILTGTFGLVSVRLAVPAYSQEPVSQSADGEVVAQTSCLFTAYEQASAFTRRYYPRQEYEATTRSTAVDCMRIRYVSDGLSVVGFIVKPRGTGDRLRGRSESWFRPESLQNVL